MPLESFVDFERARWPSFDEDEGIDDEAVSMVLEEEEPGLEFSDETRLEVSDEILSTTLLRKPGFEGSSMFGLAAPLT